MFGNTGKILRVNLSEATFSEDTPGEEVYKKYIGGAGLAAKYLLDEVPKGADPFGAENRLIFINGALGGTIAPSAGRYEVVAKSPLTGGIGRANSGGFWAPEIKRAGYDGVIFEGVSPNPVYLLIDDGKVEIKDASDLWGKGVWDTTAALKKAHGEDFRVAAIGQGGENLVKYACVINDDHRAAGRCGLGAVMGSKKLKAIVAKGTTEIEVANKEVFEQVAEKNINLINESLIKVTFESFGTVGVTDMVNAKGGFPTRNWQTGVSPHVEKINGPAMNEKVLIDKKNCFSCPISCGRVSAVKEGPYKCSGEGPEYETNGAFGGFCAIEDIEAITYLHNLCDDYSIDPISAASSIAFAMECFEKGLLTASDTDGLELKFGDPDVTIACINKIAKREGFGDTLAEGVKRISEKIGQGSESFAMHVKGLELPLYDPRAAKMCGLGYATAPRGGCHISGYVQGPTFLDIPFLVIPDSKIKDSLVGDPAEVKVLKDMQDAFTMFDSSGACKFMGMILAANEWCDMLANVTGWKFDEEDFRKTGDRIYNVQRLFNVREGMTRADDNLPKRLLEEPLPEGPAKGHVVENLDELLDAYYELRGWDKETGNPTPEKLQELGLEEYLDIVR
jgi:aldehyde:ferredoxin oxidoreductase